MLASGLCRVLRGSISRCGLSKSIPRVSSTRCISSGENNWLVCDMEETTGIATLSMSRKPVNSLNLDFLTQIQIMLEKLENEKSCKALVLTSSNPKIFSAGLDILEMYQPQPEKVAEFWRTLQEVWIRLYGSRLATVAAINGHAPAGGCLLSLCCDYRIMAEGPYTIGLNETLLGIVAPFWFRDSMINTVGHRETEYALQLGKLYTTQEALNKGLIDEVAEQSQVVDKAKQELKKWLRIPEAARALSKSTVRKETIDKLVRKRQEDVDNFVQFITRDGVQKTMGMYLESLKKKSK